MKCMDSIQVISHIGISRADFSAFWWKASKDESGGKETVPCSETCEIGLPSRSAEQWALSLYHSLHRASQLESSFCGSRALSRLLRKWVLILLVNKCGIVGPELQSSVWHESPFPSCWLSRRQESLAQTWLALYLHPHFQTLSRGFGNGRAGGALSGILCTHCLTLRDSPFQASESSCGCCNRTDSILML